MRDTQLPLYSTPLVIPATNLENWFLEIIPLVAIFLVDQDLDIPDMFDIRVDKLGFVLLKEYE